MSKESYRVMFAFTLDVWAEDEADAEGIALDHVVDHFLDGDMTWVDMFGIEADTVDPTHDSWFPINEEDKEDE